ncbi:hypothetical protein H9P43_003958 [Blastocladiella emersonii ATCC 22665]|nr:hypothetical protein H9P43_003958 [Blastocladiella emersonii ATCC 22665]
MAPPTATSSTSTPPGAAGPSAPSASLPRELLKWLGSLDLAYPVKNPRRSLSNGYLVAEILWRYYPRDVPLHGLDTGTGKRSRVSNWAVLEKIFAKKEIVVAKESVVNTIQEVPGAVEAILMTIYEHVHQRNLQHKPPRALGDAGHGASSTSEGGSGSEGLSLRTYTKALQSGTGGPTDKIITTPAAAALLSLEAIPPSKILVWDLFVEVSGIRDWNAVNREAYRYDRKLLASKVERKAIEFGIAFKTDSKPNVIHFFSFLWTAFRLEPYCLAFQLAKDLLLQLAPILCSSQPQMRDYILQALDPLLPLTQLPMLELKLGYLAEVMAGYMPSALELGILHYFKAHLPQEIYVYFLAGLRRYPAADFWDNEVASLLATATASATAGTTDQMTCGLICLIAQLTQPPWHHYATSAAAFLAAQHESPTEIHTLCMAMAACSVLALATTGSDSGVALVGWEIPAIARAGAALHDPSMVVMLVHAVLPLLPAYRSLAATVVRLLGRLRDLAVVVDAPASVQPVPYLAPVVIDPPLAVVLAESPALADVLALGMAATAGHPPLAAIEPLLPHLVSLRRDVNAAVLRAIHRDVLANITPATWSYLVALASAIAVHEDGGEEEHTASDDEQTQLANAVATSVLVTLVFHITRAPSVAWLRDAVGQVLDAAAAAAASRNGAATMWHRIARTVVDRWPRLVPEIRLAQWRDAATGSTARTRGGGGGGGMAVVAVEDEDE